MKGIIIKDCYGFEKKLSRDEMIEIIESAGIDMVWAIDPHRSYKEGDWVELLFIPSTNSEWNKEEQEMVFAPLTFDPKGHLSIGRHFYHNLALPHEKPDYGFCHSWKSDKPFEVGINDVEWVDI